MKKYLLIFLTPLLLLGCAKPVVTCSFAQPNHPIISFNPPCVLPENFRDPREQQRAKAAALIEELRTQGVEVTQIGETTRIIIQSDMIFNPGSANLIGFDVVPLDTVARLMLILETTSAKVSAYTNMDCSQNVNMALSDLQARQVEDYLWSKGVDARLIYAVGYGGKQPLAYDKNEPINRRVEINFQYIPYGMGR